MTGSPAIAGHVASACLLALGIACVSNDRPASEQPARKSDERPALRPVSLPDRSRAAASVRDQLRERHSSLTLRIENPGTTNVELGTAFGEMGKLLMAAEHRDQAEACYLNAQALVPDDPRWPYYLGHLYKFKGETRKSAAAFERALQLRPTDLATLVWLGGAYLDQGRPEDAEPLFAKARSLEHRSVAALFGLGRAALARRDYTRAVGYLEAALALDPKASSLHYPLAMAYRGLGDRPSAEAHLPFPTTGDIRPPDPLMREVEELLHSAAAFELRGAQALEGGDWAAAVTYFRSGVELAPGEPSLRHKLGTALAQTGDLRGAVEQFEEAVRRAPGFAKARYSLGVVFASSGDFENAVEQFSAAVRSEPNYVEARLQLADALRQVGRPAVSLPHYARVLEIDPRVAPARFGYAMALAELKRFDEARERLREAMSMHPGQPEFARALAALPAASQDNRIR